MSGVAGELVLRLPEHVEVVPFSRTLVGTSASTPSFNAVLAEIGQSEFAVHVHQGGHDVLGVVALNSEGKARNCPPDETDCLVR